MNTISPKAVAPLYAGVKDLGIHEEPSLAFETDADKLHYRWKDRKVYTLLTTLARQLGLKIGASEYSKDWLSLSPTYEIRLEEVAAVCYVARLYE